MVKRYNTELEKDGGLGLPSLTMRSSSIGSWVEYKDYAALEDKCSALEADNEKAMEAMRQADAAVKLAHEKFSAMAAENAGLKAICDDRRRFIMNGVQMGYIKVPAAETDPDLETIRIAISPQKPTPATDAFLAEVRAQGVEKLASLAGIECQRYKSVDDRAGERKWKSIVILCTDFATQLRKGAEL